MKETFEELLDLAISVELGAAELYMLFHIKYPEDSSFWWALVLEEKNHASLLQSVKDVFVPMGKIPEHLVSSREELLSSVQLLRKILDDAHINPGTRRYALQTAFELECSVGEMHLQKFMNLDLDDELIKVFQRLNADDTDHAERILAYALDQGYELRRPAI
jgi:rubrerythrin